MNGQFNHKEKYLYDNYFSSFDGAKTKPVPTVRYNPIIPMDSTIHERFCTQQRWAENFVDTVQSKTGSPDIDDIFQQKLSLTQDRNYLIINEIMEKDAIHKQNLSRLYDDLFMVEKWQKERPYPENYIKDKTWMDFNKMELGLRDQIRRELKDSIKSISFNEKDLRESLLDFKKQSQKNQMMGSMLEDTICDEQQKEGYTLNNIEGDMYHI
jgi:hypothetical protein